MRHHRFGRTPRRALAACLALGALGLVGCGPDATQRAAEQAARQAAARDADAARQLADYDNARAAGHWELAAAQGKDLQDRYRGTPAAADAARTLPDTLARADAARDAARLAALWSYSRVPVGRGEQRAAMLQASAPIPQPQGETTVQLVFRDHPAWGRSAYLVLDRGGFECHGRCRVTLTLRDGKVQRISAWKPTSHAAIALFLDDPLALWRIARTTPSLTLTFPTVAGPRRATFETGGADASQLPGWR